MKPCVIFNPVARGDKARRFREELARHARDCALRPTTCAGDGRRLAAEAVREGFDPVIAAGGDGTVNEVLNGLLEASASSCPRLAVVPLGTINVFARELGLPFDLEAGLDVIRAGRTRLIDVPFADFNGPAGPRRRYFAQLAGAGLDSRAIDLVDWNWKKRVGPLAYVAAGVAALRRGLPRLTVSAGDVTVTGELVLFGNGRYYGAHYSVFPGATLEDGLLDAVVFPEIDWSLIARVGLSMAVTQALPRGRHVRMRGVEFRVSATEPLPFELDGDNVGPLPATFGICPRALRVIVP